MKEIKIEMVVRVCGYDELTEEERQLTEAARKATRRSYAPYSHFSVGAAARLANGIVVTGTNQENIAYPLGLCAERTTLFYANSQYPDQPVTALAIAARSEACLTERPVMPCGACRQVMLETINRFSTPLRLLLCSQTEVYVVDDARALLPLAFDEI